MINAQTPIKDLSFIVLDFETLTPRGRPPEPIEVAAIRIESGFRIDASFEVNWLIRPPDDVPITPFDTAQTGLTYNDFRGARPGTVIFESFAALLSGREYVFVAHNAKYEAAIMRRCWPDLETARSMEFIDTVAFAKICLPNQANYKLDFVAYLLTEQIPTKRHRAWPDAELTARVLLKLLKIGAERHNLARFSDLVKMAGIAPIASIQSTGTQEAQMSLFG